MRHRLFYSAQCSNSRRFLTALARTPVKEMIDYVNIDGMSENETRGLQFVPSLQLSSGQMLVGSKCFEWLKAYEGDVEMDNVELGRRGLTFSSYETGDGVQQHIETFTSFQAPTD